MYDQIILYLRKIIFCKYSLSYQLLSSRIKFLNNKFWHLSLMLKSRLHFFLKPYFYFLPLVTV